MSTELSAAELAATEEIITAWMRHTCAPNMPAPLAAITAWICHYEDRRFLQMHMRRHQTHYARTVTL